MIIAIWTISILEFVMFILMLRALKKDVKPLLACTALITFGLFFDALGISLGTVLEGAALKIVSKLRFIFHGLLIPLLLPICAYALAFNKKGKIATWAVTVVLMGLGLAESLATDLEIAEIGGVTRYLAGENTPGWASKVSSILSFGTVLPLMAAGVATWVKNKRPELFLAGFFMFLFAALGPATGHFELIFFISMFGEILMVFFLFLFSKKAEK